MLSQSVSFRSDSRNCVQKGADTGNMLVKPLGGITWPSEWSQNRPLPGRLWELLPLSQSWRQGCQRMPLGLGSSKQCCHQNQGTGNHHALHKAANVGWSPAEKSLWPSSDAPLWPCSGVQHQQPFSQTRPLPLPLPHPHPWPSLERIQSPHCQGVWKRQRWLSDVWSTGRFTKRRPAQMLDVSTLTYQNISDWDTVSADFPPRTGVSSPRLRYQLLETGTESGAQAPSVLSLWCP